MKNIHLICAAHLDPVWLWEKEEGMAEAISTFRVAADFCEYYDGFVFNHNEAVLYKWVEEYEPQLFSRIQQLVKGGKWHIMGGWYLQPDCNMPSGESFYRQIEVGKSYFKEKFDITPTTALNFDPFGHSRGLVQILKNNGYDSYIFCRPGQVDCKLEADTFTWVGYDGSEIIGHRFSNGYNSLRGTAVKKINDYMEGGFTENCGALLWGIGNHGGGPSRIDLDGINALDPTEYKLLQSTPESYIAELDASSLPRHEKDLNPWAVGCYTSQIRVKKLHRRLENEQYMTETMALHATLQNGMAYPKAQLDESLEDLLFTEFHDILPGSSIKPAEESAIRQLNHGLEILSRIKTKAFFSLCNSQGKANDSEIPIMVYNPLPFEVETTIECEFQLADQNWDENIFTDIQVYCKGVLIKSQVEQEYSNINVDWRKHIVFHAILSPSSINRFDCRYLIKSGKDSVDNSLYVNTEEAEISIDKNTGLLNKYCIKGQNLLSENGFKPVVYNTDEDPWGSCIRRYDEKIGEFTLANTPRVIEDGEVRKVVECEFSYNSSSLTMLYKLPKIGNEIEVSCTVNWCERNKVLKLEIPSAISNGKYYGETAFGLANLPTDGDEAVAQRFVTYKNDNCGIAIFNDSIYGSHCYNDVISLTLLQSSCYSALAVENPPIVVADRKLQCIDIGEREFTFWVAPYSQQIYKTADIHSKKPYALSFFPNGDGQIESPFYTVDDEKVQVSAFYKNNDGYTLRLYETTGECRNVHVCVASLGYEQDIALGRFEIKTLRF